MIQLGYDLQAMTGPDLHTLINVARAEVTRRLEEAGRRARQERDSRAVVVECPQCSPHCKGLYGGERCSLCAGQKTITAYKVKEAHDG